MVFKDIPKISFLSRSQDHHSLWLSFSMLTCQLIGHISFDKPVNLKTPNPGDETFKVLDS